MKVFISWSGTRSKHIATALRDWLPNVLQSVRPFISSQDILKGARGNVQITKELETAAIGIICLTPENLLAPWILFEAGALSKLSSAYVCTYLYDLDPSDISPPLGQFQHTKSTKEETFALVQTINAELPDGTGLDADRLKDAFDVWWKKLQSQLKSVPDKPDDEASPPERSEDDKVDEMLQLLRKLSSSGTTGFKQPSLFRSDQWERLAKEAGAKDSKSMLIVQGETLGDMQVSEMMGELSQVRGFLKSHFDKAINVFVLYFDVPSLEIVDHIDLVMRNIKADYKMHSWG